MEYATFEPVYEAILADFGFDRDGDAASRDALASLEPGGTLADVAAVLAERDVAVVAPGPGLRGDLSAARTADAVVGVSTAAVVCREHDVAVDVYVTDLDADPELAPEFSRRGVPTVVHAHGDNEQLVREVVPACALEHVLGTTQTRPREPVLNVGGFTDGDRAAFLADHVGAASLSFPGWDLTTPDTDLPAGKRQKLDWAARLLYWLERRRDTHFDVLDPVRDSIDTSMLPIGPD